MLLLQAIIHVQDMISGDHLNLIGGKNKNHPDENDIKKAIQFYENLI